MITIGITGGSGSGKSYIAKKISDISGKWIDADAVYHDLLEKSAAMRNAILEKFPESNDNGSINRSKLASMVFTNDKALMELNSITHPFVIAEIEEQIAECYRTSTELVVVDAIALFESGIAKMCDRTIAVVAPMDLRIARIVDRDGISFERARTRIMAQKKDDFFKSKCDYIIETGDNNCDEQIAAVLHDLYDNREE